MIMEETIMVEKHRQIDEYVSCIALVCSSKPKMNKPSKSLVYHVPKIIGRKSFWP
jgi:hypothetical protein